MLEIPAIAIPTGIILSGNRWPSDVCDKDFYFAFDSIFSLTRPKAISRGFFLNFILFFKIQKLPPY